LSPPAGQDDPAPPAVGRLWVCGLDIRLREMLGHAVYHRREIKRCRADDLKHAVLLNVAIATANDDEIS
jgi:hypothetical protein